MDDIKPSKSTKISEIDFKDFIKIISFSTLGICIFFFPVIINKQLIFPIFFITDLVYLKYEQFVYICVVVFISLLSIKQIGKNEKDLIDKIDITLKLVSLLILIILITKHEFIFFKDEDLVQIMKESIFKITILLPISSLFLPFLLDYGLLYLFDCFFSRFTKRFFRVSGKNILIFLIFFFVDSFLGFYVVYKLYKEGKLRKNECINAVLNYPVLNFSLVIYISTQLKINFITLVICYLFIFAITNIIICRIYPIKNKQKTFFVKNKYKEKSCRKINLKGLFHCIYKIKREKIFLKIF